MSGAPNYEMVTLARETRRMTQNELAKRASISQGYLSRIEHGLVEISDPLVQAFSEALGYPSAFFYRSDEQYGPGTVCHHRKRQSMPIQKLKQIHATMNVMRMATADLLQGVEIDAHYGFPRMELPDYESVERIAQLVRANWQLPIGPVRNLVRSIEAAGGVVIPADFGTDRLDAISQRPRNQPPFFFINATSPGDRLRFSLAHELGHIVMHSAPAPGQEEEASRFAAEFLMPAKEIRPELEQVTLAKLADLKSYWKVSMQALIMRAHELRTITERQKRSLFTRFSQLGYRKTEPVTVARENPSVLEQVIDFHQAEHGYSVSDLSQVARLSEREFRSIYATQESPRLRVVN